MARDSFAAALAFVLKHEGGYVDHPLDPGGATNRGITRTTSQ
jgi:lysozyme family protein